MRRLSVFAVLLAGVVASGCSGGGGGGGGPTGPGFKSTGNAAIDSTMTSLLASLRTGAPLEATIVTGTVANPLSSTSTQTQTQLGQNPQDGNVPSVTTKIDVKRESSGAETVTTKVLETGTGTELLTVTRTVNPPVLTVRVPPYGLAAVTSTTPGDAYVIVNVTTTGTETSQLSSASATKTLVNFQGIAPLPSRTPTRTFTASRDIIVHYKLTPETNGNVRAWVAGFVNGSNVTTWVRQGGPQTTPLEHDFTTLTFAGVGHEDEDDVAVAVGPDAEPGGGIPADAPVNFQFQIKGGVAGVQPLTEVKDFVTPPLEGSRDSSINYSGQLTGLDGVADERVQADKHVRISTWSLEDPTTAGSIRHSLDGSLGELWSMEDAIYMPSKARRTARMLIFR